MPLNRSSPIASWLSLKNPGDYAKVSEEESGLVSAEKSISADGDHEASQFLNEPDTHNDAPRVSRLNFDDDDELLSEKRGRLSRWTKSALSLLHHEVGGARFSAWAALVIGLITLCTGGPSFKQLSSLGVPVFLKPCWRSQVVVVGLFPLAFLEFRGLKPDRKAELRKRRNWLLFAGVCATWAGGLCLWVFALDFISAARASLLSSSYPIFLVVWYKIRRKPVSRFEVLGTLCGFLGVVLTLVGPLSQDGVRPEELLGDLLCVTAAATNAAGVIWGSELRQNVDLMVYTWSSTVVLTVVTTICTFAFDGATLSFEGAKGLFGWVEPQFLALVLYLAVAIGMIGVLVQNYALKYIPPLAFAVVRLMDPPLQGFVSYMVGLDGIPGAWTWIGGLVTLAGIFIVQYGLQKRVKQEKAAQELAAAIQARADASGRQSFDSPARSSGRSSIELQAIATVGGVIGVNTSLDRFPSIRVSADNIPSIRVSLDGTQRSASNLSVPRSSSSLDGRVSFDGRLSIGNDGTAVGLSSVDIARSMSFDGRDLARSIGDLERSSFEQQTVIPAASLMVKPAV